jgi:cytochrome c oxidase accessory protein FixG
LVIALWTGFTFVGYFTPIQHLAQEVTHANLGSWEVFWVFFYAFATYGNAGFMREQVCKYMCPYARFQSVMFDKDTLIISYDETRGEPRGARSKKADPASLGLGSCIDCGLCVKVCPTGIDIRKGLQYECIGCGACADVCDQVMDKMGYPRGLVKYSTQNGMTHGWSVRQMFMRVLRPRVLVYSAILLAITIAVFVSLAMRMPLKVDVIRDRASLGRMVDMGRIENVYRLQIMNATEQAQSFGVRVSGLPGIELVGTAAFDLRPTEVRGVAVTVQLPPNAAKPGSHPIQFHIESLANGALHVTEKSTFIVPR